jgi:phosphoesterase RecJ-like protein
VATDTGDFRYSNATGRAFRAAAEMVEWGADPTRVADLVHGRRSVGSVRLLGEALQTLTLHADGRVAVIEVGPEAFDRAGASASDTEEIINTPRAVAGVEAVAFLKQAEPGVGRVSLRSKGAVDVRSVATVFGGGGHTNAAGYEFTGDLESARDDLVPMLEALVEGDR